MNNGAAENWQATMEEIGNGRRKRLIAGSMERGGCTQG